MRNGSVRTPLKHLRKDLHAVARDAEALLKATADITGDRVQEARTRAEKTVSQAFDHLYDDKLRRRVRKAARTTDAYVRDHSWGAVAAAVGLGLLIGLLARRE